MFNERRNQLLETMYMYKSMKNNDNIEFNLKCLLESFERDIDKQLKDLEYQKNELESNKEVLAFVRKELGINE